MVPSRRNGVKNAVDFTEGGIVHHIVDRIFDIGESDELLEHMCAVDPVGPAFHAIGRGAHLCEAQRGGSFAATQIKERTLIPSLVANAIEMSKKFDGAFVRSGDEIGIVSPIRHGQCKLVVRNAKFIEVCDRSRHGTLPSYKCDVRIDCSYLPSK